jgi:hypothetical protein
MIEYIEHEDKLLSIIVRSKYESDGIQFFTPDDFSQQLGYMKRDRNYVIKPHTHNAVTRDVAYTQEVLFIKSGEVRIDFYTDEQSYLLSKICSPGDVVLLAFGGHGLKMMQPSEIIEVKQGPYAGEMDKNRFEPVPDELVRL